MMSPQSRRLVVTAILFGAALLIAVCSAGCFSLWGSKPDIVPDKPAIEKKADAVDDAVNKKAVGPEIPVAKVIFISVIFGGLAVAAFFFVTKNVGAFIAAIGAAIVLGILIVELWLQVLIGGGCLALGWCFPSLGGSIRGWFEKKNGKKKGKK